MTRALQGPREGASASTHLNGKPLIRAVPGERPAVRIGGADVPVDLLTGVLAELGFRLEKVA